MVRWRTLEPRCKQVRIYAHPENAHVDIADGTREGEGSKRPAPAAGPLPCIWRSGCRKTIRARRLAGGQLYL
jgi:hypothetical protein